MTGEVGVVAESSALPYTLPDSVKKLLRANTHISPGFYLEGGEPEEGKGGETEFQIQFIVVVC